MLTIIPAKEFSTEQLTDFYNQTRVDYLVPMPMSVEVMGEYIHDFDVNLDLSPIIFDEENNEFLGLGMLACGTINHGSLVWV